MSRIHSSSNGFTLIEVLIAGVIFMVLVGALFSILHGALRLRESTFEAVEAGLPRDYIMMLIKRDITNMVAPAGALAGPMIGERKQTGAYRTDRLEFHTASGIITEEEPFADIQKVEYYLTEPKTSDGAKGNDLVRAVTRNLLASIAEEPDEEQLLSGIEALEFRYFNDANWQDSWDSTTVENQLPSAVAVQIDFLSAVDGGSDSAPIEMVCEIVAMPRQTESKTGSGLEAGVGEYAEGF